MKRLAYTRRAPRSGSSASFSLFPFLAVLICTMGVLILLLVLISQNARERLLASFAMQNAANADATANADAAAHGPKEDEADLTAIDPTIIGLSEDASEEEIIDKLKSEAEVFDWLTQETLLSQKDTLEQLDDARGRVGLIEKNIATLVKELEQLHEAMRALSEKVQAPADDLAKLQKTLAEKQKNKESAEKELEKIQKDHANIEQSYAVVPYRGPNGTYRRPIYIECRGESVIIQPEGIELQPFDFLMPDRHDNPMEMGVRTVRQYLVETQQLDRRDTEPYPLFLVRPSGIDAYEAALRSLGSWQGDHGYELIGEDWNLEFQQPSEELKQRLTSQIQIARVRQEGYIQAEIANGVGRGRKRQFRASSQGGVEQISGPRLSANTRIANGTGTRERIGTGTANETATGLAATSSPATAAGTGTGTGTAAVLIANQPGHTIPPAMGGFGGSGNFANQQQTGQPQTGQTFAATDASMRIASSEEIPLPQAFPQNGMLGGNGMSGNPISTDQLLNVNDFSGNYVPDGVASNAPIDPNGTGDSTNSQTPNPNTDPNFTPNSPGLPSLTFEHKSRFVKEKKPKNWALKDRDKHKVRPVDRIVRIRCDKTQYTLVKQPGLFTNRSVLLNDPRGNPNSASERLVQTIWDYMESWGSAGENHFWRPLLKVQVVPGAEEQFEILKSELAESGIGIEKM